MCITNQHYERNSKMYIHPFITKTITHNIQHTLHITPVVETKRRIRLKYTSTCTNTHIHRPNPWNQHTHRENTYVSIHIDITHSFTIWAVCWVLLCFGWMSTNAENNKTKQKQNNTKRNEYKTQWREQERNRKMKSNNNSNDKRRNRLSRFIERSVNHQIQMEINSLVEATSHRYSSPVDISPLCILWVLWVFLSLVNPLVFTFGACNHHNNTTQKLRYNRNFPVNWSSSSRFSIGSYPFYGVVQCVWQTSNQWVLRLDICELSVCVCWIYVFVCWCVCIWPLFVRVVYCQWMFHMVY